MSMIRSVRLATRTASKSATRAYVTYEDGATSYRSNDQRGARYDNRTGRDNRAEGYQGYQENRGVRNQGNSGDRYTPGTVRQPYNKPYNSQYSGQYNRPFNGQYNRPRYNDQYAPQIRKPGQSSLQQRINEGEKPPHLKTLADLSPAQIQSLVLRALAYKRLVKQSYIGGISRSLQRKSVAMIFSKRSTRTRVAGETAMSLLGGHPMFLGSQDIQLGVNETLADSAKVISSMTDGIFARVGKHEEIEEMAQHSAVPVINALSDLYHPTQILADLLTLVEHYGPSESLTLPSATLENRSGRGIRAALSHLGASFDLTTILSGKKVAWVGDTNNISNELLVALPRFGMRLAIASPKGYDQVDPRVWARVEEAGTQNLVQLTNSPAEALKDADVVVTDTWISMGQEEEKAARLKAFEGYQITNDMVNQAGAKNDWIFMHCLPRKQEEVDDEVFYGDRSVVFQEAENRKWTIAACFHAYFAQWGVGVPKDAESIEAAESTEEGETD